MAEYLEDPKKRPIAFDDVHVFSDTLQTGDLVYILERKENPDTKFGTISQYGEWSVVKKFPFTVQIEKKGARGYVSTKCVPYGVLMIEQRNYRDLKAKNATESLAAMLAADIE